MYRAVGGSVVWEDPETGIRSTQVGVHCKEGDGLPPDNYLIGVDSTDPGMTGMVAAHHWKRSTFPGRPDLIFAAEEKICWVEAKTNWADFESSRRSKRLAREVRTGQQMADVVIVAHPAYYTADPENLLELIRLQSQGILCIPWDTSYEYWDNIRVVLSSGSNLLRAVSGSDHSKPHTALAGLPGVGKVTERKLLAHYGNAHLALLAYGTDGWAAPLGEKQVQRIEIACRHQPAH